jgi:gas vesicle protein
LTKAKPEPIFELKSLFVFRLLMEGGNTMETQKNNYGNFFKGVMVGGLLGGFAGIFLAPKSGKEFRSDIQEKGSEALNEAKKTYSETQQRAKAFFEDAKDILARAKGKEKTPAVSEYAEETGGEA